MRKRQGRCAWIREMLVLFGVLFLVEAPAVALAAGGASPEGAAAIEQARQAEAAGRLDDAVGQLENAYELVGDPELLFRLGELTSRLGQDVRALRLYRTYLTREPRGKNHAAAERRIAILERHVPAADTAGALAAAVTPPVTPVVDAPPPAAADPDAAPGLRPAPAPAAEPQAALTAIAGQSSSPPIPRWAPWAGLSATVGLAIAARVSGVHASARFDQLRNSCGATAAGCSEGQIDDVRLSANRTTAFWVAAGVLAAVTGAGFYVNTREAGLSGVWRF